MKWNDLTQIRETAVVIGTALVREIIVNNKRKFSIASRSNSKSTKGSEVKMAGRASGRIVVGSDGENSILCFSVEPGTGTSGTQKQFIDIEVSPEQLEDLGQSLQTYQELKDE